MTCFSGSSHDDDDVMPFRLVMTCPSCGKLHIDRDEWATRPHKTHLCVDDPFTPPKKGCGYAWRPSEYPTVGVATVQDTVFLGDEYILLEAKNIIRTLIAWTSGSGCSDCEMYRRSPADIVWQHEKDCGHLEAINKALVFLGLPLEEGYEPSKKEKI